MAYVRKHKSKSDGKYTNDNSIYVESEYMSANRRFTLCLLGNRTGRQLILSLES